MGDIKFKNGSKIEIVKSKGNIRGCMAKYWQEINDYLANLSDEEFMQLLEECGLENCPYVDDEVE